MQKNKIQSLGDYLGAITHMTATERECVLEDAEYHRRGLIAGVRVVGDCLTTIAAAHGTTGLTSEVSNEILERIGRHLATVSVLVSALNTAIDGSRESREPGAL